MREESIASFVRKGTRPDLAIVRLRDLCERHCHAFSGSSVEIVGNHDI
jgi:hypothetical protein